MIEELRKSVVEIEKVRQKTHPVDVFAACGPLGSRG